MSDTTVTERDTSRLNVSNRIGLSVDIVHIEGSEQDRANYVWDDCWAPWTPVPCDLKIPDLNHLAYAAAVARCLSRICLRGNEIRAIRRIVGWSRNELIFKIDYSLALETFELWEEEYRFMSFSQEKKFREIICEQLSDKTPGVKYQKESIKETTIIDPRVRDRQWKIPPMWFTRTTLPGDDRPPEAWKHVKTLITVPIAPVHNTLDRWVDMFADVWL